MYNTVWNIFMKLCTCLNVDAWMIAYVAYAYEATSKHSGFFSSLINVVWTGCILTEGIQWLLEKNGLFRIKATFGGICQFVVTALVIIVLTLTCTCAQHLFSTCLERIPVSAVLLTFHY